MGGVCSSKEKTMVEPIEKTMIEATPQNCPTPLQSVEGEDWVVLKARSTLTNKLFKHKFPSKSIVVQVSWVFWCVVQSFFSKWLLWRCHWVNNNFNMYWILSYNNN
jgi:hypothetical protein